MSITGVAPPVEVILFVVPDTEVTVPVVVERVPEMGNVTFVDAEKLNVAGKAPAKVNAPAVNTFPPKVIVLAPLLTPVPPYVEPITVLCHVPVAIVPKVVIEDCPT